MNERILPSIRQIAKGVIRAVRNGEELLEEAQLLHENGRYARAFALATLSIEELGKSLVLARLIYTDASDVQGLRAFWRNFRSHHRKLGDSILLGASYWHIHGKNESIIDWAKANLKTLKQGMQEAKESSLYVNFENRKFTLPSEIFMDPKTNLKAQLMIAQWMLAHLKSTFTSEKFVLHIFRAQKHDAKLAGFPTIKYEDSKSFYKMLSKVMSADSGTAK